MGAALVGDATATNQGDAGARRQADAEARGSPRLRIIFAGLSQPECLRQLVGTPQRGRNRIVHSTLVLRALAGATGLLALTVETLSPPGAFSSKPDRLAAG